MQKMSFQAHAFPATPLEETQRTPWKTKSMYCYCISITTVLCIALTQTAVGQDDEGVRLAAAPAFLTPGGDGDRSF